MAAPKQKKKPAPNDTLRPGFRLSRYTILRRLSSGGFGVVYVARREDGQLVAIKEFLPSTLAVRTLEDRGRSDQRLLKLPVGFAMGWKHFSERQTP